MTPPGDLDRLPADDGDPVLEVLYRLAGSPEECRDRARMLAIEETAEVSPDLCDTVFFHERVLGRVGEIVPLPGQAACLVTISYPGAVVGRELPQWISVIFGNVSLWPGVRVEAVRPSRALARSLPGPAFGIPGIRRLLEVPDRPLVMSAVKPLGRTVAELARMAEDLALGGIDLLKDDHGITDQDFAPFRDRVRACCEAVRRAQDRTGRRCLYFPTVTAPADEMVERARWAADQGAGGLLVSPWVAGLDCMRALARQTGLPVMAHPALAGAFFAHEDHGIAMPVAMGTLVRLAGADLAIFPGPGGRFAPAPREVAAWDRALKEDFQGLAATMPVPAGGLPLEGVAPLIRMFGRDVTFLVGSSLYRHSPDLQANAAFLRRLIDEALDGIPPTPDPDRRFSP
ncbi:ribulose 1,5-bisphosphate carboxylase large subunit [Myxococcota bacterium]|nr:ribulose 1,5-bisphosphate carboxylase large subunit [Myxococcota bacterium]